jgi:PAS domain S-box-containing protein
VLAVLLGLALVEHPTWPGRSTALWVPATGLGMALLFWFGYRAALLLIPAAFLAGLGNQLLAGGADDWTIVAESLGDGVLQAGALAVGLWAFRRCVPGEPSLSDPRSAIGFLVVPGLVLAAFSLLRSFPVWILGTTDFPLQRDVAAWWVAQALGLYALTPPLLLFVTHWLIHWGLLDPERPGESQAIPSLLGMPDSLRALRLTRGAWVEIGLLAGTTVVMSVLLTLTRKAHDPGGWQLWGAPLLLVVWAGIRQGLRGASLVAAAGTAVPLGILAFRATEPMDMPLLVQGNLLAQCATALLVASSVSWIRANEERYRQVVNLVPVVLYSVRVNSLGKGNQPLRARVLFISPPCQTLLGCPPEQLLGDYHHWMKRVHPYDREILRAALVQLTLQDQPVVCEYRLVPPSIRVPDALPNSTPLSLAGTRWVRDVLVPHFDENRELVGWEGIASDITEQRVLADELRRTTSMLDTLLGNLPAGVFFVSARSGRPILVNQRARELLGQREDVVVGLDRLPQIYRLHRPDGSPYPPDEFPVCQVLQRGTVSMRDDVVVHRPDGRKVPLISWAAPVDLGKSGKPDAIVWVLEDMSELHQAEAARRETERRLRTVIESLADGLLVQDQHGNILDCNPAAASLLGPLLESADLVVAGNWLREDGSPLPAEEHPIRRVLRLGKPVQKVVVGLKGATPGASRRWLLISSLPMAGKAGSTPTGVVTTLVDVTVQVRNPRPFIGVE